MFRAVSPLRQNKLLHKWGSRGSKAGPNVAPTVLNRVSCWKAEFVVTKKMLIRWAKNRAFFLWPWPNCKGSTGQLPLCSSVMHAIVVVNWCYPGVPCDLWTITHPARGVIFALVSICTRSARQLTERVTSSFVSINNSSSKLFRNLLCSSCDTLLQTCVVTIRHW